MDILVKIVLESWEVLVEAAPYVLFGFFAAGLLKAFVPDSFMNKHLGKKGVGSIVKASALGVPLPLCSCGVLPAAMGLRRQGASKGASTAFMISTPETGVDSIAITYALLDPFMTVIRPVAAFLTSIVAGTLVDITDKGEDPPAPLNGATHDVGHENGSCGCSHEAAPVTLWEKFKSGMIYAFDEMIGDIGKWLLVGVIVAGLIGALMPQDFLEQYVGSGIAPMLVMLAVGLPLYVCATASTPIAASLLLKGLSPGAALVFLLVGPATNGATITVMLKVLGKRAAGWYLITIMVCSLALGYLTNVFYTSMGMDITAVAATAEEVLPHSVGIGSAIVLLLLVAYSMRPGRKGG